MLRHFLNRSLYLANNYNGRVNGGILKVFPALRVELRTLYDREINPDVEKKLKEHDKIPEDHSIIYRAPLLTYVKFSYYTVFVTSIAFPSLIGSAYLAAEKQGFPIYLHDIVLMSSVNDFYAFCGGLILATSQVAAVVYKYPIRIYADPDRKKFIAVYLHFLPGFYTNVKFEKGEVTKKWGIMPWSESLYRLGKRGGILMENHFTMPAEMNNMISPEDENNENN